MCCEQNNMWSFQMGTVENILELARSSSLIFWGPKKPYVLLSALKLIKILWALVLNQKVKPLTSLLSLLSSISIQWTCCTMRNKGLQSKCDILQIIWHRSATYFFSRKYTKILSPNFYEESMFQSTFTGVTRESWWNRKPWASFPKETLM